MINEISQCLVNQSGEIAANFSYGWLIRQGVKQGFQFKTLLKKWGCKNK